jgi:4-amino-4-deoxy-L-arabinose transferase-like glycosyltransferase
MKVSHRKNIFYIVLIFIVSASLKLGLQFADVIPFNSDEAIVALMARHILQGELPVFFYGQVYMGSLDAFMVAGGFALFGQHVWVIRLVQTVLFAAVMLTTAWVAKLVFGDWKHGWIAACFLSIPTVNVTLYTTATLGGYNEAMLLGNLVLALGMILIRRADALPEKHLDMKTYLLAVLWGTIAGCGLWANGLSLVYSLPAGLVMLWAIFWRFRVKFNGWQKTLLVLVATAGIAIGASPWLIYAIQTGPASLMAELFGTAVAVEKTPWLIQTGQHLFNFVLLGLTALFGFRPPWGVRWLGLPMMPVVLVFWGAVVYAWFWRWRPEKGVRWKKWMLTGVGVSVIAGFVFTPFGVDPSGRYFLPLYMMLVMAAADGVLRLVKKPQWQTAVVAFVLVFHLWGTLQCALRYPPGITTQFDAVAVVDHHYNDELIDFLKSEGETRGYSNYWVSYPTAFLSEEEVIFVPALPYHLDMRFTTRDDRYEPYRGMVASSENVVYITTNHPELNAYLRDEFEAAGVSWQEKVIGDYQVFYDLSRHIRPVEMGLGMDTP